MPDRSVSMVRDSVRLLSLSVIQRLFSVLNGFMYLAVLTPAAYAAWRSIMTLFQLGLPGWSLLQSDLAKRRSQGDETWVAAWKGMLLISVALGFVLFCLTWAAFESVVSIFGSVRGYESIVVFGSVLFLTTPLRTSLSLWWQVTGRFDRYSVYSGIESIIYTSGLLIGFFYFRAGVVAVPIALVASHLINLVLSGLAWSFTSRKESIGRKMGMRDIMEIWKLARGEGKWVVLRESSWDWYETLKVALLNALLPAPVLGIVFAAETLATYANSVLASLQPLLQVRVAETKSPAVMAQAGRRATQILVTASWLIYGASIPVLLIIVPAFFPKYANALSLYPFFALQLLWSAISLVVTPQLYALDQQIALLRFSIERNLFELGLLITGALIFSGGATSVVIAHIASGYFYISRRVALVDKILKTKELRLRLFFPSWAAMRDAVSLLRKALAEPLLRRLR